MIRYNKKNRHVRTYLSVFTTHTNEIAWIRPSLHSFMIDFVITSGQHSTRYVKARSRVSAYTRHRRSNNNNNITCLLTQSIHPGNGASLLYSRAGEHKALNPPPTRSHTPQTERQATAIVANAVSLLPIQ